MKVLIKRENHETKPFVTDCCKCGSQLEVSKEDIKADRDGNYFVCPVCDQFNATT